MRTLSAQHDSFALNRPFRIARGTKTAADGVTVTIRDGAYSGRGEGVPYARYGESIAGALAQIDAARGAVERGASRSELLVLMPAGAARNAVDCALWDLEARIAGSSVSALLGQPPLIPMACALTVVIDTPAAMAQAAREFAGAPLLKVKVNAHDPEAQVRAVRAAAPHAALIVDPNESWSRTLLTALDPLMAELKVALIEQPVSADDDDWLVAFTPGVPICADEAVHTVGDLERIAARYQVVNVKLDKAGGLTAGIELAAAARGRGLGLMAGCMVGSSLAMAPALQIARRAAFVDLDGPIFLAADRAGGLSYAEGMIAPPAHLLWGEP